MVGGRADGLRSLRDRWTVSKDGRARVRILRGGEGVKNIRTITDWHTVVKKIYDISFPVALTSQGPRGIAVSLLQISVFSRHETIPCLPKSGK